MRFLFGILVGIILTVVVTFILDSGGSAPRTMVNWDVVGEKVGTLTADAREVWNDFTREITGPP